MPRATCWPESARAKNSGIVQATVLNDSVQTSTPPRLMTNEAGLNFLVIRLSSIGDIVHTLPAVAALGRSFPQAEISWLVEKRYASLLAGNPYVSRVLEVDTLSWRKRPFPVSFIGPLRDAWRTIRERPYSSTIDFQGLIKTGIFSFAARSQRRLGFAGPWLREPGAGVFYTQHVPADGRQHIVELNLALVEYAGAKAGAWEFPLPSNDVDDATVVQQLASSGVGDFILISPGGGWKAKRWPPESYAALISRLAKEFQLDILLTGSPDERECIQAIIESAATSRARYFPANLVQYISLARRARLLIGGDTGPLHLAAAAGTPLVAIFDATDPRNTPERNGPFNSADITVIDPKAVRGQRASKTRDFLRGIPVEAVFDATRERWKRAYG